MSEINISENTLAAVILCGRLIKDENCIPLTVAEWHHLVMCIDRVGFSGPSVLLGMEEQDFFDIQGVSKGLAQRIFSLIQLRDYVEAEIKRLYSLNIFIAGMDDGNYPLRLISRLSANAPPVFFYYGDGSIINSTGIAVVGSRDIDEDGAKFAGKIGAKAADESLVLISGGARGADSIAQHWATECGGKVLLFLAEPLIKRMNDYKVSDMYLQKRICLMSDHNPSEPFSASAALCRNRYIYLNSEGAFVAASEAFKGGSFRGAKENISRGVVPTFVYNNKNCAGNKELIKQGGFPVDKNIKSIRKLILENVDRQLSFL